VKRTKNNPGYDLGKRIKGISLIILVLVLFFTTAIIGCGGGGGGSDPDPTGTSTTSPTPSPTTTESPSPSPTQSPSPSPSPTESPTPSPTPTLTYTFAWKKTEGINEPGNLGQGSIVGVNNAVSDIFIYNENGTYVANYAIPNYASGIATDENGYHYVTSGTTAEYYKFDPDWTNMTTFSLVNQSEDIAAEYQTNQIVVLSSTIDFYCFEIRNSTTGEEINSWWGDEYSRGTSVAFSPSGLIYASFLDSNKVVCFDQAGNNLERDIEVYLPYGIHVDSNGYLYVAHYYNEAPPSRAVFTIYNTNNNNQIIGETIIPYGTGDGQLNGIFGIITDSDGNIYLTSMLEDVLVKFTKD